MDLLGWLEVCMASAGVPNAVTVYQTSCFKNGLKIEPLECGSIFQNDDKH